MRFTATDARLYGLKGLELHPKSFGIIITPNEKGEHMPGRGRNQWRGWLRRPP